MLANKSFPARTPQQNSQQQKTKSQATRTLRLCPKKVRWSMSSASPSGDLQPSPYQLCIVIAAPTGTFEDSTSTFTQPVHQALHFCNNLAFQIRWPSLSRCMDSRIVNRHDFWKQIRGKALQGPTKLQSASIRRCTRYFQNTNVIHYRIANGTYGQIHL